MEAQFESGMGSAGVIPGIAASSAEAYSSLFARAQQVAQSKQMFPLLKQQLAGQIAINSQSQEMNNLAIQKQLAQADLIRPQIDTQLAQLGADKATALTQQLSAQSQAQMLQAANDEFPTVMSHLNSVTGTGPSTAPVALPDASMPVAPAPSPGAAPSAAAAATPPTPGGLSYEGYQSALGAINVYKARFGQIPGAAPLLSALDAKAATLTNAYGSQVLGEIPDYHATIDTAKSTADLQTLASNPEYQFAAKNPGWNTGLADQYKDRWTQLATQEQKDRDTQAQATAAALSTKNSQSAVQLQRQQENSVDPSTGYTGITRTAADAKDFALAAVTHADNMADFNTLLTIANSPLGGALSPTERVLADGAVARLQGAMRVPITGGRVSDMTSKFLDEVVANPTKLLSLSSSNKTAIIDGMQTEVRNFTNLAKANGLKPSGLGPGVGAAPTQQASSPSALAAAIAERERRAAAVQPPVPTPSPQE